MTLTPALRREICDTIRMLAADAVEKANSGHPGTPMALADIAFVLFHDFLRFDPRDPMWFARDRFVLSCGHASMLQYAMLHLWGYPLSLDDLKAFRQWESRTPGHPEAGHTEGVEVTTGPLGQGVANSVGMALAAKMLGARVGTGDFGVAPQRVFVLCSDGDLMEGISSEAASLAGHWKLGNLVWLYDDNKITIDGDTALAFSEDVGARFAAFGWHVQSIDGHDAEQIQGALSQAVAATDQPSLIVCRTHIGFGSPNKVDKAAAHGSPLGGSEIALTKQNLGWPAEPTFHVPEKVRAFFAAAQEVKHADRDAWETGLKAWRQKHPAQSAALDALLERRVPDDLGAQLVAATPAAGPTRKLSGAALARAAALVPSLVGGSADLTESNGTEVKGVGLFGAPGEVGGHETSYGGRQVHFGIREHAMASINNGVSLHGGFLPFGATFLVFSDYLRPALRLAALSHVRNTFVFTHDSVFLGEDGPTHQPIEHHWALRIIPGVTYFRPADGIETAMAWAWALQKADGPVALGLTRQALPAVTRDAGFQPEDVWRGAYVVTDAADPEIIVVGTGSELQLAVGAAAKLTAEGRRVRVVSMPAWDLFVKQPAEYRARVLPAGHPKVATIEAGITGPWLALASLAIGIDRFGASAPAGVLAEKLGLTVDQVAERLRRWA